MQQAKEDVTHDSHRRIDGQHYYYCPCYMRHQLVRDMWQPRIRIRSVLFDPYKKYIQSDNETILDQGAPIKTSLVANIRAAYYIINKQKFISQAKNT